MKITYEDKEWEVEQGSLIKDVFSKELQKQDKKILACRYNNEVKAMDVPILENAKIEFLDFTNKDGKMVYVRGLLYIMAKAFHDLYPDALLTVNYQLSNSMFCEVDNQEITDTILQRVSEKMQEIIEKDYPIKKVIMSKEEAEEFYEKHHNIRGKLQLGVKEKEEVSLYFCENYYNYFYGVMPLSTGYIKVYEIMKYRNGFLVRYPNRINPNVLETFEDNKKLLATLQEYEDIHKLLKVNTVYRLNSVVKEGNSKEIILLDEALHEKKLAQLADIVAQNKEVKMVLIAGPSSSGKTTFAQRLGLQLRLNGLKPVTISVDNYFVEREDNPKDAQGNYDFECIEAIDLDLFNTHLVKLLNGEEIEIPTFNFNLGKKEYNGEKMKLAKDEILVIEGIHCLNDKLTQKIPRKQKYKIYISALTVLNMDYYNRISTTDTRLIRRIVRDYKFRGYSALHTLKMWYSVKRGEEKNIFPYQEEADSMFNTSLVYELGVLKDYAMPLLMQIENTEEEYSEARRLYEFLSYFESIPTNDIPENSLIKEFIGGGVFKY